MIRSNWRRKGIAVLLVLSMALFLTVGAFAAGSTESTGDGEPPAQTELLPQENAGIPAEPQGEDAGFPEEQSEPEKQPEPEKHPKPEEQLPLEELFDPEAQLQQAARQPEFWSSASQVLPPTSGLRFDAGKSEYAEMDEAVTIPGTAELWINLDAGEDRRQIIFNDYKDGLENSWGLELTVNNELRYWERVSKEQTSLIFSDVAVCTGDWVLLSVVRDLTDQKVALYLNGEFVAEKSGKLHAAAQLTYPLRFGTDTRNNYYLDGEIAEVRMWSDARTAEEIAEYAGKHVEGTEDGLAHAWILDEVADLRPDTVFEDLAGGVDVKAVGYKASFDEPDQETAEAFTIDFSDDSTDTVWRGMNGGTYANASVSDGALHLTGMAQNQAVFLTGENVPYLSNAAYEVRARVNTASPAFGVAFRGSIDREAANWLVLRSDGSLLAQTSEKTWQDPWTGAEYALEPDTWYDFKYSFAGKTVKMEVKADGEAEYTVLADGADGTVWDGWLTDPGYIGFCSWGPAKQDYDIASITVTPLENGQTHTVSFELNGGEGDVSSVTVQDGGTVTQPSAAPKKSGFTFTGWYQDSGCTKPWNFSSGAVWKDTVIYAGWKYDYKPAGYEMTGVSFDGPADQLAMENRLSAVPLSFEATVKLPKNLEGRGGVIIGNYMDAGYYDYDLGYVSLEVYNDGAPRLYWQQERRNQPGGDVQSVVFSGVDLRQGEWVHLAVTFDPEADTVRCYVDGVLVSTVKDCRFNPVIPAQALKIGGDYRGSGGQVTDSGYNAQYFKGEISNVSVWSDVRTEVEIQADAAALKIDGANVPHEGGGLLAGWSFADGNADLYEDVSANDNDAAAFVDWIDPGFAEGDYSMVALPDTQFLSQTYPAIYQKLTRWIVDNEQTYNIQAVIHMGDMVNSGNTTQWNNCANAMYLLDESDIAWMPMRGNHDPSDGFNTTFPYSRFSDRAYFGGSYEKEILNQDKLDCNYWEVSAGGRDYLILSLGWAPTQGALDWAKGLIEANPEKNVIVTTHAFMYWDGTHLNDEDLDYTSAYTNDGMDGSEIWAQLGGQYENVVLAMGGHIGFPDVIARTDKNGGGKEVTSLLCDAQGIDLTYGLGMMMLLTFHENSDRVDVNWYSAEEGKLFRTRNQFSIDVPHVGGAPETESHAITGVAAQAAVSAQTGTTLEKLGLPATVSVTLDNGGTVKVPVTWSCGTYDPSAAGTYTFTGALGNAENVTNPQALTASVQVTLFRQSSNIGGDDDGDHGADAAPATSTSGGVTTTTASVTPAVSGTAASAAVSSATANRMVNSALSAARNSGTDPVVELVVKTPAKAESVSVTLPVAALKSLAAHDAARLKITSGVAGVTMDSAALAAVADQAGTNVTLSVTPVAVSGLTQAQREAADGSPVFDISLTSGGAAIHDLDDGSVSISVPYTLAEGQTAKGLMVCYLDDGGNLTACETSYAAGAVTFSTTHLSKYVITHNAAASFTDVDSGAYYYDAVQWAVERKITLGSSAATFDPDLSCTRGQIVTFLWRANGSPAPVSTENPFSDVSAGDYDYSAVLWAVEQGITSGTGGAAFSPDAVCTRAQVATLLWRASGSPTAGEAHFADVPGDAYYAQAVAWAASEGITSGTGNGLFSPAATCTRAQVVTFLYRAVAE